MMPHHTDTTGNAQSRPTDPQRRPLLDQRAALILLISVLVAAAAGLLTFLWHRSVPEAVLAGGGAFGGTLALLHQVIG